MAQLTQYISSFTLQDISINSSFVITPPSVSSALPVILSVMSGPATIDGNTVTVGSTEGLVIIAANQFGDINYITAPTVTASFRVFKNKYAFSMLVNNFFYQPLQLPSNFTGTILQSGFPSGLYFDVNKKSILGASIFTGSFHSYIYPSGTFTGYIGFDFTVYPPTNAGYLYAFGSGIGYQENIVPNIFLNTKVLQIAATDTYNLATAQQTVYIDPPAPVVIPPIKPPAVITNSSPYTFIIRNNSNEDCIDDFTFVSTITGNFSGYLDNNFGFGYKSGSPGATSVAAVISSGYGFGIAPYVMPSGCVSMVFAGGNYGIFILKNGQISGWGDNTYGQVLGGLNLTGQCPPWPSTIVLT